MHLYYLKFYLKTLSKNNINKSLLHSENDEDYTFIENVSMSEEMNRVNSSESEINELNNQNGLQGANRIRYEKSIGVKLTKFCSVDELNNLHLQKRRFH